MIFNSIRWRLQLWHGLTLVAVLAGFGFTAYHVARENQMRRIDQELDQQLISLFRPERRGNWGMGMKPGEPPGGQPPEGRPEPRSFQHRETWPAPASQFERDSGPPRRFSTELRSRIAAAIQQVEQSETNALYFVYWSEHDEITSSPNTPPDVPDPRLGRSADSLLEPGPPGRSDVRSRGRFRELYRFLPGGTCALVGRSLAPDFAAMHRLALWLTMAGAGVLLIGLTGGWWVAARAMRPIEEISATAQKISAADLSQRINVAGTDDELSRLAEVLNSAFARLEAAFAQQARFTSDASHELRTPLAVILTQTQSALARPRSGPEYVQALEVCQRAAQRMRKLTEALLALARLDAAPKSPRQEVFDVAQVARECREMLHPLAKERGIELREELASARINGDPEQLAQVVTNLLTNAIQYNVTGGFVLISTASKAGAALLTVTDSGVGISSEDLPHVFERFYRADKSRSQPAGRTGLGLAICQAIVEAHQGNIAVTSEPGKGSTFTVSLPAA
jgi:signal transduction histidine kinase